MINGEDFYTDEDMDRILDEVNKKLVIAMDREAITPSSTPIWANIMLLLDKFNEGNFYGTLAVRISDNCMENMKIDSQTFKLETVYKEIFDKIFTK
jgi:hypothetical protein